MKRASVADLEAALRTWGRSPHRDGSGPERIQAAITLALDAALPNLVREITEKVLVALGH